MSNLSVFALLLIVLAIALNLIMLMAWRRMVLANKRVINEMERGIAYLLSDYLLRLAQESMLGFNIVHDKSGNPVFELTFQGENRPGMVVSVDGSQVIITCVAHRTTHVCHTNNQMILVGGTSVLGQISSCFVEATTLG